MKTIVCAAALALLVACDAPTAPTDDVKPSFTELCTPTSTSVQCRLKWGAAIGLSNLTLAGCIARQPRECIGGLISSGLAWNDWWRTERPDWPTKKEEE